jgi:catecholate siderophore receptor
MARNGKQLQRTQLTVRKRNKGPAGCWPVAYRWLATGTLMAYTAVGMSKIAVAQAPAAAPAASTPPASSQPPLRELPVCRFDVAPGPLGSVLDAFAIATGLQVTTTNETLRDLPSRGVHGLYAPEPALRILLAGSGAGYRFGPGRAVTIELERVVTAIDVIAEGSLLSLSSPKYSEPLRNTPQTIASVARQTLDQQGATTLRDSLRNVAGISLAAGEGGAQGDNLTIRGFTARNDLFIDGMRDFGSYYRDPFNTEEVQVLEGPSSVVFGRGSTGGVVNQSTKAPQLRRYLAGDLQFGTDRTRRLAADLNAPVPPLGDTAALRLNLMGQEGGVAGRDVARNRRFGAAPSLALGLGTSTRWTFAGFHQVASDIPDYGIPWLFDGPAPVDRSNYYGFRDGNYLRTYADIGTARVEHDFSSRVTLRNQARYSHYTRHLRITEAKVPTTVTPSTPLADVAVTRSQIAVESVEAFLDDQADLTARFQTGRVTHTVVTGLEAARETSAPVRQTWSGVPSTSLLDPDPNQAFAGSAVVSSSVKTNSHSAAAYVLDTVKFGRRWELTGGARWDRFNVDYRQTAGTVAAYRRLDTVATWRAAAVYKPLPTGSVYFAASTSFNPSAESLSLSSSTASLPPEKNRNLELGSKWDLNRGRLSLAGALFRTEKLNAREPDPNNTLLNVLAGNQRVDGVQFEAHGRVLSRWEVLSGYAYLDARVVKSNYYPAAVGARLANVPAHSFNIWNNLRLPGRWQSGVGANFVSSRTASSTAPFDTVTGRVKAVPGYWVFNAMASHPLHEHADLQLNVYNLANRYYYDQLHPGHIVPGPGRSALIGIRFKF